MTIFDWIDNWFDNLFGYNRRKLTATEKVPALQVFAETSPIRVIVDETTIFIWLQKQIEWETGIRLPFFFSTLNKEFPELKLGSIKDLSLIDDIGMDSLELTELLIEAETHFNMEILNESAVQVRTVGDALNLISKTLLETQISK